MNVKALTHGPTITITATTPIVCGTTSGYEEYACLGMARVVTAAQFESDCVMMGGTKFKPATSITYPAGFPINKFFTTLHLASGSLEVVPLKELPSLENG